MLFLYIACIAVVCGVVGGISFLVQIRAKSRLEDYAIDIDENEDLQKTKEESVYLNNFIQKFCVPFTNQFSEDEKPYYCFFTYYNNIYNDGHYEYFTKMTDEIDMAEKYLPRVMNRQQYNVYMKAKNASTYMAKIEKGLIKLSVENTQKIKKDLLDCDTFFKSNIKLYEDMLQTFANKLFGNKTNSTEKNSVNHI